MSRRPLRCLAILVALFAVVYASAIDIYQTQDKQNFYWMFWESNTLRFSDANEGRALTYSVRVDTAGNGTNLAFRAADSSWTHVTPEWDTYKIYFYDNTPRTVLLVDSTFTATPEIPPGAFSPDSMYMSIVLVDYNGGIEKGDDSLNVKLDGVTLVAGTAGLKVDTVAGVTGADEDNLGNDDLDALQNVGALTEANGDILYYNTNWTVLNKGDDGQVCKLASGLPSWAVDDDVPDAGDFGAATDLGANGALNTGCVADNEIDYVNVTFADFDYQTAWRVFYSDNLGDVTELALGADGTYLKSNGATAAPTFAVPGGGGDMMAADFDDSLNAQGFVNADSTDGPLATRFWAGITYQPLEATLTDIADGTIVENLVNTANPWAADEIVSTVLHNDEIDASSELAAIMDDETGSGLLVFGTSPSFTTSINIPNAAAPVTDAEGEIAWDSNDDALEVYSGDEAESVLIPMYQKLDALIFEPDGVNDQIAIMHVDALLYPHGIEIDQLSITLPADAAYSMVFEEWAGDPPVAQNDIDTVTTTGADAYMEDGTPTDGVIDADDYIFLDIPATDVDWIHIQVIYHLTEGN